MASIRIQLKGSGEVQDEPFEDGDIWTVDKLKTIDKIFLPKGESGSVKGGVGEVEIDKDLGDTHILRFPDGDELALEDIGTLGDDKPEFSLELVDGDSGVTIEVEYRDGSDAKEITIPPGAEITWDEEEVKSVKSLTRNNAESTDTKIGRDLVIFFENGAALILVGYQDNPFDLLDESPIDPIPPDILSEIDALDATGLSVEEVDFIGGGLTASDLEGLVSQLGTPIPPPLTSLILGSSIASDPGVPSATAPAIFGPAGGQGDGGEFVEAQVGGKIQYFVANDFPKIEGNGNSLGGESDRANGKDLTDVRIKFSQQVQDDVTLRYAIQRGGSDPAQANDLVGGFPQNGKIEFKMGQVGPKAIPITLHEDHLVEGDETFHVRITEQRPGHTYGSRPGVFPFEYVIEDNDQSELSIDGAYISEGSDTIDVVVRLSNPVDEDLRFNFDVVQQTADGTDVVVAAGLNRFIDASFNLPATAPKAAIPPDSYDPLQQYNVTQIVSISLPGSLEQVVEGNETFLIRLNSVQTVSGETRAVVRDGTRASAEFTIIDDDRATVTIADVSVNESDMTATITFALDNPVSGGFSFDVNLMDETATGGAAVGPGVDFVNSLQTVTFVDGSTTSQTITVALNEDLVIENTESFFVSLSNLNAPGPAPSTSIDISDTATVTIANSDMATADLSVTTQGVEGGADIVFTVTLDKVNETGSDITFDLAAATGGTATNNLDYIIPAGAQITVADGALTGTYTANVTDDLLLEPNVAETVIAEITNSSHPDVMIGAASATADITDNDTATADLSVTTQGVEGGTDIVFMVTLDKVNNTGAAIIFPLADATTGTATAGTDYGAIPGTITIADGASSGSATVTVTDDVLLESLTPETVAATISAPTNPDVTIGTATATATITDNDTAIANLSVATQGDEAGAVGIVFTVTLDKVNNTGAAITFELADLGTGTSTGGADYGAFPATISIADGASSGSATVTVTDDMLLEADVETVAAQIINPSDPRVTIGTGTVTANITDNDTAIAALSVSDGTEAGADIVYTVTLDKANDTGAPITFDLARTGGTATSGVDFTAIPGGAQITVAEGATTGTFTVSVTDDLLLESNTAETVIAEISNSSNPDVTIGTASATADITDNDTATADLSVTTQGVEGGTDIVFTVTLDKVNNTGAAIIFPLADATTGTATAGTDYGAIPGTITIANGASSGSATVTVTDDMLLESLTPETVAATISAPTNPDVTTGTATATATITDNDTATANLSVTTQGDEAGPAGIVFTVTLDKANNTGAAITFELADLGTGTATGGADYGAFPATISIADGATSGSATVTVTDDMLLEASVETVAAQIINPSDPRVTIGTGTATANITDNDMAIATLSVSDGTEAGADIVFTVTLDKVNDTGSDITFDLADDTTGTATSGVDYTAIPVGAQITVAAGATTGIYTLSVIDDLLMDGLETVDVTISNPSNTAVNLGTSTATANINDNETGTPALVATADLSVTTQGLEAGMVAIVYTVTLDSMNTTGSAITFDLVDVGTGTATSGSDYTAIAGGTQITVANGMTTGTASVMVSDDALLEADMETVIAQIQNPSDVGVVIGTSTATATITDDDTATAALSVTTQGVEGGTDIVFTVTLDKTNDTGSDITFDLATTGTATPDADYTAIPTGAQITVATGVATGTYTVHVADDDLLEPGTETVVGGITNQSNTDVMIGTPTATATITDNDTATADLSVTTQGVEGGTDVVFTVTLDKVNNTGAAIIFTLADATTGTATAGTDYGAIPGTITIADGASSGTATVTVTDDMLLESLTPETVAATISAPTNLDVSIGTASATATITDNDTATADLSVTTQGLESGTVAIVYTVTLDKANNTGSAITFDLTDLGTGTATAGSDYGAVPATISIADGMSSGTATVTVTDDSLLEADMETVIAQIQNPSDPRVVIGTSTASATITDDDTANAALSVTSQGVEGGTDIVFTVTLDKTNDTGSVITFDLANPATGTATSNADYTAIPAGAQIAVATGAATGTFTVHVADDDLFEADTETVVGEISNSSNTDVTIATPTATATITDNDTVSAALSVTTDGAEPSTAAVFTVTLDKVNNTGANLVFDLTFTDGTATGGAGNDYTNTATQIVVANGAQSGSIPVPVLEDALLEPVTENFTGTIAFNSAASPQVTAGDVTIGTAMATANIADDDTATVDLSVTTQGDESGPVAIVFTVTLDKVNNTGTPITFELADLGTGSATAGSDYGTVPATISIADGMSSGTATVPVTDDLILDAAIETVVAQIINPSDSRVSIGTGIATANITDNEMVSATLTATDGNEEGTNVVFTVTLDQVNNTGAPINFNLTLGGTATNGADYANVAGAVISVAEGSTTGTFLVDVSDDDLLEPTQETVIGTISSPSDTRVMLATPSATANIADNEATTVRVSPIIGLGAEDPVSPDQLRFEVKLDHLQDTSFTNPLIVQFTLAGTATAGRDYSVDAAAGLTFDSATGDGTVEIQPGQDSALVNLTIRDDSVFDDFAQETVEVTLTGTTRGGVMVPTTTIAVDPTKAILGILDNEPVIVDLDGDGIEFAPHRVAFDIDDDGEAESVVWAGADDGFLAYDANGNGQIDQRAELVMTEHAPQAETDLAAIRLAFDSNNDDLLTELDEEWSSFGIWQDRNSDGVTDQGEFYSLNDLSVTSIRLTTDGQSSSPIGGARIHGMSELTFADGSTAAIADTSLASIEAIDPSALVAEASEIISTDALVAVEYASALAQQEAESESFAAGSGGEATGNAAGGDSTPGNGGGGGGDNNSGGDQPTPMLADSSSGAPAQEPAAQGAPAIETSDQPIEVYDAPAAVV